MNYLAIDTSGKNLTVIICNENKIYSYYDNECGVNHSVSLMTEVENLSKKADFDIKNADFLACVIGAGSFTGIRIGVATVKALCFAFNKPCLAITSFDTLAYNKQSGKYLAVIDAKHGGYYVAGYTDNEISIEPQYILKDKLIQLAKEYKILSSAPLDIDYEKVDVVSGLINAVKYKRGFATFDLDGISPLYCRKSQAEEGRP